MARKNRILIVELVGAVVALVLGTALFFAATTLATGIDQIVGEISSAASQGGEIGDVEGYGILLDLGTVAVGDIGVFALMMLAVFAMALVPPAVLFAIIARISCRPRKHGRYVVLTALALAPLAIIAAVSITFAFGDGVRIFWIGAFLIELAVIVYCVQETSRMFKEDGPVDPAGPYDGGSYVPSPEDAR